MSERKVMIRGQVFSYKEKAPFVPSGVSVFGAVEYDFAKDRLRCHECGEWFAGLSAHISFRHTLTLREYKVKHGLRLVTKLVSESIKDRLRRRAFDMQLHTLQFRSREEWSTNKGKSGPGPNFEARNEKGICTAQMSFKLLNLAKALGQKTLYIRDLKSLGIYLPQVLRAFDVKTWNEALAILGLEYFADGGLKVQMRETEWL